MIDIEAGLAATLAARLDEHRDEMIAYLVSLGYKVTKPKAPKAKAEKPALNAIGKPFSPQYDPSYKPKYKTGSNAHLFKPYSDNFRSTAFHSRPKN